MTGRIEIDSELVDRAVYKALHFRFQSLPDKDLEPGKDVACLHWVDGQIRREQARWGIHPIWANHLIYNAHAETVTCKKTFAAAYSLNRCIVPCSAWFEWTGTLGHKVKHRFSHKDGSLFFIAGILYPDKQGDYELVTITTLADINCGIYHERMPLLIKEEKVLDWLQLPPASDELAPFHDLHPIRIDPPIE